MSRSHRWRLGVGALVGVLAALAATVLWLNLRGEEPLLPDVPAKATADQIAKGAYLARAGNCAACHTDRGGVPYAGGRAIETPFGNVYAGNLTPDMETGLGAWSQAEFWRALHHGRSRDGRLLTPAFPYANFTLVTRADADNLRAYLRSLAPVQQAQTKATLRWPFNTQAALAVWRALYFRAGSLPPDADRSTGTGTGNAIAKNAEWQRGAYLVNGLGHCNTCHAPRNWAGASGALDEAGGGTLPLQGWIAPSLAHADEAGVLGQPIDEVVRLLKTGVSDHHAVMGPMSDVVAGSTQHLLPADLRAMVVYLATLAPPTAADQSRPPTGAQATSAPSTPRLLRGQQLYADHCTTCHGAQGQGAPGIYPALATSRTVALANPRNLVQAITHGGFPPATAGNPQPYGMPAFDLPHADVAALATWLRASWGLRAAPVSDLDVLLTR